MKERSPGAATAGDRPRREDIAKIKTRFAKWFDQTNGEPLTRKKLLSGIDVMVGDLDRRSKWSEAMTVALDDSADLAISVRGTRFQAIPCADCLAVATVVPGWGFGWQNVFGDSEIYEILSWFTHFVRQYIHRCDVAKVLMIAWETDGRVLHPLGSHGLLQQHGAATPTLSVDDALNHAVMKAQASWGSPSSWGGREPKETISNWSVRNTLDPSVHQSIFHFLRAQNLLHSGFGIEALVAFDCAMQALGVLLTQGGKIAASKGRHWICQGLGLPNDQEELANYVYFLRNEFGAHAGGWRWWDQDELLNDELMGEVSALVARSLRAGADAEPSMRRVEPDPANWAAWFVDNFEMLWEVVWYERLSAAH